MMVAAGPACVVPVPTETEEPPLARNYAPYVVAANPPLWTTFSVSPQLPRSVSVTLGDPNSDDVLHVAIWADPDQARPGLLVYQPTSIPPRVGAEPAEPAAEVREPLIIERDWCALGLAAGRHTLELLATDRPIADIVTKQLAPGALSVTAGWTLELQCAQ